MVRLALASPFPVESAPETADTVLVERMIAGERAALAELYRRYAPGILRMLVRLLASTNEAEDALQETFVIAFHKATQLRDHQAARAWLTRIAVREAHARLKRRRRWSLFGLLGSTTEEDASLVSLAAEGASSDTFAELALLDRQLATLPAEQRCAWVLRYVEGESLEDVASSCGCSLATAKRWISAADQVIRRHVHLEDVDG